MSDLNRILSAQQRIAVLLELIEKQNRQIAKLKAACLNQVSDIEHWRRLAENRLPQARFRQAGRAEHEDLTE